MKVSFKGRVEINDDEVDSRSDVDHALLFVIGSTIRDAENADEVYDKLKLSWSDEYNEKDV
jgi:hypothetical protein